MTIYLNSRGNYVMALLGKEFPVTIGCDPSPEYYDALWSSVYVSPQSYQEWVRDIEAATI